MSEERAEGGVGVAELEGGHDHNDKETKEQKEQRMQGKVADNIIHLKNGTAKRTKEGDWFNEFGYPLWVPKSMTNMRERAHILKEGISKGRWKGETLKRAEDHLARTEAFLRTLQEERAKSRARSSRKRQSARASGDK